jgi:tetratricopeptide (TPR) repeat protein
VGDRWRVVSCSLCGLAVRALAGGAAASDSDLSAAYVAEERLAAIAAGAEFLGSGDRVDGRASTEDPPDRAYLSEDPWTLLPSAAPFGEAAADRYLDFEDLCLGLCGESLRSVAAHPERALQLAQWAVRLAGLAPGAAGSRSRLEAVAWAFVANAHRVRGDFAAAASTFRMAWRLWEEGKPHPGTRLAEWRLFDLEASLRRDQRRFPEALRLIERALAVAPGESKGRILIKKSSVLEQSGEIAKAVATLDVAAPLIENNGDPEESWMLRFNRGVLLCHLGRFSDVEEALPALYRQAAAAGYDLDVLRVRWLSARVSAGMGRHEDARASFEETRTDLARRGLAGDAAMVSLELALLHFEAGRFAEVRNLASEAFLTFSALKISSEAMSAVRLFHEAAESQSLTVEFARSLLSRLERARGVTGPRA